MDIQITRSAKRKKTVSARIGFHSPPGPADLRDVAADGVELGYAVAPSFRRQGFAKEAALALMKWAFETHGQRCFILSIAPSNEASLALARLLGFSEIGSNCTTLLFRSWIGLGLSLLLPGVLLFRIRDEEVLLRQTFGERWDAYCRRSWRPLPWVY